MASRSPAAPVHEWDGIFRASFLRSLAMLCGGIVALLPGECGICVWSPALEPSGNSHAGSLALEHFTSIGKRSIF